MRILCSILCAQCIAVVAATYLSYLHGSLTSAISAVSLTAGLIAGVAIFLTLRPPTPAKTKTKACNLRPSPWEWAAIVFFAIICFRAFAWLIYTTSDHLCVLSPNNLGDLSLHWQYIQQFANGAAFWPDNPLVADGGIRYPIGVDLLTALPVTLGTPMIQTLIWIALLGATLSGIALFLWGRGIALVALLCNGGLFGFVIFSEWVLRDFQADQAWKNVFLSIFVTQRGVLYALPVGLLLMTSWRARAAPQPDQPSTPLPLWTEGLLYGTMPLFHLHTFLFLSLLLGWQFLFGENRNRLHLLSLFGVSVIPATALTLLVTDAMNGASVVRWQPGWMQHDMEFFTFWIGNFGIFPLLAIASAAVVLYRTFVARKLAPRDYQSILFTLPGILTFFICAMVVFAPWEWDNTKLFLWAYLCIIPYLWDVLLKDRPVWLRAVALIALFFSGFVSLIGGLGFTGPHNGYTIARRSEIDALAAPLANIPPNARIACAPHFGHPVVFHGRKLALAYTGHLVGHGHEYRTPEHLNNLLMNYSPVWRIASDRLHADYLLWGPDEIRLYQHLEWPGQPEHQHAIVASGDWGTLFDLRAIR